MSRKVAVYTVVVLIVVQLIVMLFLDVKYNELYVTYLHDEGLRFYFIGVIFYAMLNDAIIFSIGFLIYKMNLILKSRISMITGGLLLFSIVLVFASGLYYGLTLETNLIENNLSDNITNFMNTFYVAYILCLFVFVLICFRERLVIDKASKSLLISLLIISVTIYFRQSSYFGVVHDWTFDRRPRLDVSVRQVFSYIILYPASVSLFIMSTIILIKDRVLGEDINTM